MSKINYFTVTLSCMYVIVNREVYKLYFKESILLCTAAPPETDPLFAGKCCTMLIKKFQFQKAVLIKKMKSRGRYHEIFDKIKLESFCVAFG